MCHSHVLHAAEHLKRTCTKLVEPVCKENITVDSFQSSIEFLDAGQLGLYLWPDVARGLITCHVYYLPNELVRMIHQV